MSDERHIEAAFRHADTSGPLPWRALPPDEVLMAKEELGEDPLPQRADLWENLLVFLFADENPECWENVALRGLSLMRHCAASLLSDRDLSEAVDVRARATVQHGFRLTGFVEACEDEEFQDTLRRILLFLFPDGRGWLEDGCRRIYLIARAYQPHLVEIWRETRERVPVIEPDSRGRMRRIFTTRKGMAPGEMSYEDMARIFREDPNKARQRWSARAKRMIRMPIENAGGTVQLQFGKSASTRKKYRQKAMGNQNRKIHE